MGLIQAAVLGLVQGITEFIPVSSSAHLILTSYLFGWQDQGLAFDMAVHGGSLLAVIAYLRGDIGRILSAWRPGVAGERVDELRRLGLQLAVATLPVAVIGLLMQGFIEQYARSPLVVAVNLIVFGLLLWLADRLGRGNGTIYDLSWAAVLAIGLAQALAIVPGTSRSGVTMTAALAIGLARTEAARFSFLLAVPTLSLVAAKTVLDLTSGAVSSPGAAPLLTGFAVSMVAAYLAIGWMMRWLTSQGMAPFSLYRVILGAGILALYLL
jgi:undecaprenyl-diphosphatase